MTRPLPLIAALCWVQLAGIAGAALGQGAVPEIPLTAHFGVGARSLGMGGTGVAVADDFSALHFNAAGLGLIRQTELSLSMARRGIETDARQTGAGFASSDLGNLRLNALGFVVPLRTYRGSLVFAGGIYRSRLIDREVQRPLPGGREWEIERGGPLNWTAGMAVMVAPSLILGGRLGLISGSDDRELTQETTGGRTSIVDDTKLTGWTGSLGMLFSASPRVRIGATLDLPEHYTIDGTQTFVQRIGTDPETSERVSFEDDLTLPYAFGLGVAVNLPHVLLTADTHYSDWREIDFAGPLLRDEREAYRETATLHLGVEGYLPNAPIRLRAGYQREPLPYRRLPDFGGDASQTIAAHFDEEADYVSLGAGFLVAQVLNLDVAYVRGGYVRATDDYREEITENRVVVTASYRPQRLFPSDRDDRQ